MPEVNKIFNTDDVVWYYPFPRERLPLRNTRYKAIVLDAIEDHHFIHDTSNSVIRFKFHPDRKFFRNKNNLVLFSANQSDDILVIFLMPSDFYFRIYFERRPQGVNINIHSNKRRCDERESRRSAAGSGITGKPFQYLSNNLI